MSMAEIVAEFVLSPAEFPGVASGDELSVADRVALAREIGPAVSGLVAAARQVGPVAERGRVGSVAVEDGFDPAVDLLCEAGCRPEGPLEDAVAVASTLIALAFVLCPELHGVALVP